MPISKIKISSITADASSVNLNIDANTLYLDAANNRVGVGTTSPAYSLDVYGQGARLYSGSAGSYSIMRVGGSGSDSLWGYAGANNDVVNGSIAGDTVFGPNKAGASLRFLSGNGALNATLDSNGNFGLGVVPNTWYLNSTVYKALQFGASGILFGTTTASSANFTSYTNSYLDASAVPRYQYSSWASKYDQTAGSHVWHTAPLGTAGNAITFTQAMALDANGNLGIGTTPVNRIDITGTSAATQSIRIAAGSANTVQVALENGYATKQGFIFVNNGSTGYTSFGMISENTALTFKTAAYNIGSTTDLTTSWTERARISSSGVLAINNTSPESTVKLQVSGANNGGALVLDLINNNAQSARMNAGNTNNMLILRSAFNDNPPAYGNSGAKWGITFIGGSQSGSYSAIVDTAAQGKAASIYAMSEDGSAGYNRAVGLSLYTSSFDQNQAERLRVSADGTVRVGGSTGVFTGGNGWLTASGDNVKAALSARVTSNGYWGAAWHNASDVNVGTIVINSTGTAYNTSSDYRLKTSVEPMTGALARVALLKPCTYTWISDNTEGEGFIAHELAEVCPHAVTGEKDAVDTYLDEEGNEQTRPRYQGIDTSFLVATLTAAIQEQQALITQLTDRIAALEAK